MLSRFFANIIIHINFFSYLFSVSAFGKRSNAPIRYAQHKNTVRFVTRKLNCFLQQMFKLNFKFSCTAAAVLIIYTNKQ